MLLVVDVGNTNITFGVYHGGELLHTFRLMSKLSRTSDEYGFSITNLLEKQGAVVEDIKGVIIASVVPDLMHSLINAFIRYFDMTPLTVGPGIKTGIRLMVPNPKELGADRIVDAVAAYEKYGGPVLVMDFGTATTYDLVTGDGAFIGGITAPGLRLSAQALWEGTAKLPEIEIKRPDKILGHDTTSSMQSGLVYGQIGQTEYIVDRVKAETGLKDLKVVATGGLGRIIADNTDKIDIYDSTLTLDGLRRIYNRNQKN